jgi:hypothetical protein
MKKADPLAVQGLAREKGWHCQSCGALDLAYVKHTVPLGGGATLILRCNGCSGIVRDLRLTDEEAQRVGIDTTSAYEREP